MSAYLIHHGILGQKWGVRRFQNKDGSLTELGKERLQKGDRLMKAGSEYYRIDSDPRGKTYDNKKYLSTNKEDNDAWEQYLGGAYVNSIAYKSTKDIWVASATTVGEVYVNEFLSNKKYANQTVSDLADAFNKLGDADRGLNHEEAASLLIAAQTKTGKKIVNRMLDLGYDAVEDYHGKNVSKDPIIMLDPDKRLDMISSTKIDKYVLSDEEYRRLVNGN